MGLLTLKRCRPRFLTNLSFILFGLSGLLGIAVVLHHMLRGPCRVLPPPTRPPSPAAVPNSAAAHTAPAAAPRPAAQAPGVPTPNGVTPPAAGGAARVPFPYPMLPASAAPSSAAGHAPDRAGAGSGQWHGPSAGPGPAEEGPGDAVGAVHDADVHALVSGDWPVYEVLSSGSLVYGWHLRRQGKACDGRRLGGPLARGLSCLQRAICCTAYSGCCRDVLSCFLMKCMAICAASQRTARLRSTRCSSSCTCCSWRPTHAWRSSSPPSTGAW